LIAAKLEKHLLGSIIIMLFIPLPINLGVKEAIIIFIFSALLYLAKKRIK
jgi:hypothetical protein